MTGGGSSELRSLRSEVARALEICRNHGHELQQLAELVGDLQAAVAELRVDSRAAAGLAAEVQSLGAIVDAGAPKASARRRAKGK